MCLNLGICVERMNRTCEQCGKGFDTRKPWARFCSPLCRRLAFKATERMRIIRDYLAEIGKKGAAARMAKRLRESGQSEMTL